jgi:hypothetical protein
MNTRQQVHFHPVDTTCPQCGNKNTMKLSAVWSQGTSITNSTSFYSGRRYGTRQSTSVHSNLFAQQCAPPDMPVPGVQFLVLFGVSLSIAICLYLFHEYPQMYGASAFAVLFFALYLAAVASADPHMKKKFRQAQSFWSLGWVCKRCSCKWVPERSLKAAEITVQEHEQKATKPVDQKLVEDTAMKPGELEKLAEQDRLLHETFVFCCPQCSLFGRAPRSYCGTVVKCSRCKVELQISDVGCAIFRRTSSELPSEPEHHVEPKQVICVVIFHRETLRAFVLDAGYKLLYPLITNAVCPPKFKQSEKGWLPSYDEQRPIWIEAEENSSFTAYWYDWQHSPKIEDIGAPADEAILAAENKKTKRRRVKKMNDA